MPPYPPSFAALGTAFRDQVELLDALGVRSKRGLTGGWFAVMGSTPVA
jgi:hypothetical protein